jgi:Ribonucleotide reductase, beta subunit
MAYTTFSQTKNDQLKEPMFFGQPVNVARYDQQKYDIFEKLIEKQLSFFWRPEEVDVSRDRIDFQALPDHEKHIFISNLKYQTLLDSIQGRSPNVALLPLISIPELETWVETWAFSETIHSRSYTHIIRNIVNDPAVVFDDIVTNEQIQKRAEGIAHYYDTLIEMTSYWHLLGEGTHNVNGKTVTVNLRALKKQLYLCLMSVNALEAIRFYVSFACSFAFAERKLMEGNAKIIRLIARDEALHLTGTQHMMNLEKPYAIEIPDSANPRSPREKPCSTRYGMKRNGFWRSVARGYRAMPGKIISASHRLVPCDPPGSVRKRFPSRPSAQRACWWLGSAVFLISSPISRRHRSANKALMQRQRR